MMWRLREFIENLSANIEMRIRNRANFQDLRKWNSHFFFKHRGSLKKWLYNWRMLAKACGPLHWSKGPLWYFDTPGGGLSVNEWISVSSWESSGQKVDALQPTTVNLANLFSPIFRIIFLLFLKMAIWKKNKKRKEKSRQNKQHIT